jgi:cellulose biosynthesis protein BcsQ
LRREAGDAYCVIDTSPGIGGAFRDVHGVADLILLPTRASMLDVASLGKALGASREARTNMRIFAILNQIDERLVITKEAIAGLDAAGVPQFATHIMHRTGYARAAMTGVYDHPEIAALVREIRNHLS